MDFVRAISVASKTLSAYPPGHPALTQAFNLVKTRLRECTALLGKVELGVTREGLLYGEDKLDFPQAKKLAESLYLRDVAILSVGEGTTADDMVEFLRLLASDPRQGQRRPIWEELSEAGVQNIQFRAVDFSELRVTSEISSDPARVEEGSLWEHILRALLTGKELSASGAELRPAQSYSATGVASVLSELLREGEPKGSGFGRFEEISEAGRFQGTDTGESEDRKRKISLQLTGALRGHFNQAGRSAADITPQQIGELLRSVPPELRHSVLTAALRALASQEATAAALDAIRKAVPSDDVVRAFRELTKEGVTFSGHALRLLETLSEATSKTDAPVSSREVTALVRELTTLFADEDIDRFNPLEHQRTVEDHSVVVPELSIAEADSPEIRQRLETMSDEALAVQLSPTLLELVSRHGTRPGLDGVLLQTERVFRTFISSGRLEETITLVETLRKFSAHPQSHPELRKKLQDLLERLAGPESIATLLEWIHTPSGPSPQLIQQLIDRLGSVATRNLLFALAEEKNRSRRRKIFDAVASLGPIIVPEAKHLLTDPRWYVVRNMIVLLRTVGDRTSLPEIRRFAHHSDLRLQLEAIKTLFAFESNVSRDLLEKLIHDPDPKLAEMAIALVGNYGIVEAVDPLLAIVEPLDLFGRRRSLRLRALRALGELAVPSTLPRLRRYFKGHLIQVVSAEERQVAFEILESFLPADRAEYVQWGMRSKDPKVKATAERLSAPDARAGKREVSSE